MFIDAARVLRLARRYLLRLIGAGLLAVATEWAGLALMGTATWLLITASGQPPVLTLTVAIVTVRFLAISRGVLRYTERLAGHDAVLRLLTEVRARIFARLVAEPPSAQAHRSGDALSRLVSDVDAVQDLLLRVLVPGAAAAVVGGLSVAAAAAISPAAAGVLGCGLLVAGVVLPGLALWLTVRTADLVAPLRAALAADTVDLTHGAADLAAFGATAGAVARAAGHAGALASAERRLARLGGLVDAAGVLVSGGTAAAVVAVALRAEVDGVLVGVLGVGTLAAVESVLALVAAARRWAEIRGSLRRLATDLEPPAPVGTGGAPDGSGARPAPGAGVVLRGALVRYRPDGPPALDSVDLTIPPGHRVAVVGPSGSGKSTLVGLLAGLVPLAAGSASRDGLPLTPPPGAEDPPVADEPPTADRPVAADRDPVRPPVTGLLAEAHIFHATVRDNLLLGRPDAADAELAGACAAAGLLDWVHDQPETWDTVVGEDGGLLSGGQRQRLALARALLAGPDLLLLDEPTEGLDPAAADAVLASVLAAAHGSVLLVTHRLHALESFDEIVVLGAGGVLQRGTHLDLCRVPGWYREQWLAQEVAERGYQRLAEPVTAPGH